MELLYILCTSKFSQFINTLYYQAPSKEVRFSECILEKYDRLPQDVLSLNFQR